MRAMRAIRAQGLEILLHHGESNGQENERNWVLCGVVGIMMQYVGRLSKLRPPCGCPTYNTRGRILLGTSEGTTVLTNPKLAYIQDR